MAAQDEVGRVVEVVLVESPTVVGRVEGKDREARRVERFTE